MCCACPLHAISSPCMLSFLACGSWQRCRVLATVSRGPLPCIAGGRRCFSAAAAGRGHRRGGVLAGGDAGRDGGGRHSRQAAGACTRKHEENWMESNQRLACRRGVPAAAIRPPWRVRLPANDERMQSKTLQFPSRGLKMCAAVTWDGRGLRRHGSAFGNDQGSGRHGDAANGGGGGGRCSGSGALQRTRVTASAEETG